MRETENEKEIPSFKILRSLESVKKVYGSEDLKEGASSFVKKTDPNWKDKQNIKIISLNAHSVNDTVKS